MSGSIGRIRVGTPRGVCWLIDRSPSPTRIRRGVPRRTVRQAIRLRYRCSNRRLIPLLFPSSSVAGMQNQIVCRGCRTVLLYPQGAPSVFCAVCQAITTVPPPGTYLSGLRVLSFRLFPVMVTELNYFNQLLLGGCNSVVPCGLKFYFNIVSYTSPK
jgi:LSD1 subclass zinc finger protein